MENSRSDILLIGMPMSGKSTIGKALSEKIKYTFNDMDNIIENKYKQTAIFFLNIFRKNKRVSTYIFFFFVSFFFWFLSMLSKTHETVFEIPVDYINNPADLVSTAKPTNFINLSVKASGFSLVSYYLFNNQLLDCILSPNPSINVMPNSLQITLSGILSLF